MPENMIARLGSRPMTIGKTNVAPNIATTCWAPSPVVRAQVRRWFGATASPGSGWTTSHLNIDGMTAPPCSVVPGNQNRDHQTAMAAPDAGGTPRRSATVVRPIPLVQTSSRDSGTNVGCVIPVSAPPRVRDRLLAAPDGPVRGRASRQACGVPRRGRMVCRGRRPARRPGALRAQRPHGRSGRARRRSGVRPEGGAAPLRSPARDRQAAAGGGACPAHRRTPTGRIPWSRWTPRPSPDWSAPVTA